MEKKKLDMAFVILHYMAVDDTIECISSVFEHNDRAGIHVIVVDNASPDGSGAVLEDKYSGDPDVTVIKSSENLGFARGNNLGFRYAKENFDCRYIILSNNDIVLFEDGMLEKTDSEYKNSGFAVLGPMILTRDGRYTSNPQRMQALTKKQAQDMKKDFESFLLFQRLYIRPVYIIWRRIFRKKKKRSRICDHFRRYENVTLHGSFMIFSRDYIDRFDGLDDRTFMYGEEDILHRRLIKNGLKSVYTPDFAVYHKEDVSTDSASGSSRKKREFYYKNLIASLGVLIDEITAD